MQEFVLKLDFLYYLFYWKLNVFNNWTQVKCEFIEKNSQDVSDGWFRSFSFLSVACYSFYFGFINSRCKAVSLIQQYNVTLVLCRISFWNLIFCITFSIANLTFLIIELKWNVNFLKKNHRMWATGDFKVFRFKVLHAAPQRKRGSKYSFSEVLIQWITHSVKYSFSEVLIQWRTHSVKYSFR